MGQFNDMVFNKIRSDFIQNGPKSVLYRFVLENEGEAIDDKTVRKKANALMYNLGYPLRAERMRQMAEQNFDNAEFDDSFFNGNTKKTINKKKESISKNLSNANLLVKNDRGRKSTNSSKKAGGHKNTALNLVDMWASEHDMIGSDSGEVLLTDCEEMFRLLKKNPLYQRVKIPVRIDNKTGAAIYIVGNEYYPGKHKLQNLSCQLAIYGPSAETEKHEIHFLDGPFPSVKEALDFYTKVIPECMDTLTLDNCEAPIGTPKAFEKYFDSFDDILNFTDEEYQATINEFKPGSYS